MAIHGYDRTLPRWVKYRLRIPRLTKTPQQIPVCYRTDHSTRHAHGEYDSRWILESRLTDEEQQQHSPDASSSRNQEPNLQLSAVIGRSITQFGDSKQLLGLETSAPRVKRVSDTTSGTHIKYWHYCTTTQETGETISSDNNWTSSIQRFHQPLVIREIWFRHSCLDTGWLASSLSLGGITTVCCTATVIWLSECCGGDLRQWRLSGISTWELGRYSVRLLVSILPWLHSKKSSPSIPIAVKLSTTITSCWILTSCTVISSSATPRNGTGEPSTLTSLLPFQGWSGRCVVLVRSQTSFLSRQTAAPVSRTKSTEIPPTIPEI